LPKLKTRIAPGAILQRDRFSDDDELDSKKILHYYEIKVDQKLTLKDRLLSEIAQLKAILGPKHPASPRDRELAARRLVQIRKAMLSLLGGKA
jgi:hypothetical protein